MNTEPQKYWRLLAERPQSLPDVFDLRVKKSVFVGDDSENDICIDTIAVPFQFRILKMKRKGPVLNLTSEVIPSFQGEYSPIKEWKTRLYNGREFAVTGPCEFKVGDTQFKLLQVEALAIEGLGEKMDPVEKKQWGQSIRYTFAAYSLLFLISFIVGTLINLFSHRDEELQVQKITVADVKKIIRPPAPQPIEVVEETKPLEPRPVDIPKAKIDQAPQKQKAVAKASREIRSAAGKTGGSKPRNIQNLGLLAIQTTPGASQISMGVSAPKMVASRTRIADAQLGLGNATSGVGIADGDSTRVAQLGSISGQSYEGGIGDQLQAARIPSIALSRKEVEVRGALDPAVIRQIIEERLSEIRYCYENALLKQKELSGKVAASWTIRPDGSVSDIQSGSDEIRPEILQPCIRMQIKSWRFPNPKGGGVVRVKYPFVFSPVGGQK